MLYRAHQIALWPRLLAAAAQDPILRATFQDLMQRGAALSLTETGGLQLSAGEMPEAEYAAIRAEKLAPCGPKVGYILQRARTGAHPWLAAVQQAYADLDRRCAEGDKALMDAAQRKDVAAWMRIGGKVIDRHLQAMSLARALVDAGYGSYTAHASKHLTAWTDLAEARRKGGTPFDAAGRFWPVQTPDGWIWVIDAPDAKPQAMDLGGKIGVKAPLPDEPVITDWDLGRALSSIEIIKAREAM